jgi:hypothetical protein
VRVYYKNPSRSSSLRGGLHSTIHTSSAATSGRSLDPPAAAAAAAAAEDIIMEIVDDDDGDYDDGSVELLVPNTGKEMLSISNGKVRTILTWIFYIWTTAEYFLLAQYFFCNYVLLSL